MTPTASQIDTRPAWVDKFLESIKSLGTITAAAHAAGVSRSTVYELMGRDPEFKAAVDRVKAECVELVEDTLFQCALKPGNAQDRALYLRAHRPEKYADRIGQHQAQQIREQARKEVMDELNESLSSLPEAARRLLVQAIQAQRPAAELPAAER